MIGSTRAIAFEGYSALRADSGGRVVSFGFNRRRSSLRSNVTRSAASSLIVLSTSLVLVLASLGARRFIHRPLGQLVGAANQWRLGEFANLAEHLKVLASQMEGEVKMLGKYKRFRPALIWTVRAEYSVARIENWTSHAR
jgi:hypothetical protein